MASATFSNTPDFETFGRPPRILIIGAGSRGTAYAEATLSSTNAVIAAVCEPIAYKRNEFGRKFIWGEHSAPVSGQAFSNWTEWVEYETKRRRRAHEGAEETEKGINGVFVCVLDELHEEVVTGIAKLGVHVCCEKPMSTRLKSCINMYNALNAAGSGKTVFGICHVLRYSPHNMLLRHLVREEKVVGDILSIEHVEPVGWWHFSHSYVRGNWRKESKTAPSLLTKSCHDIDFLMWMLCSPAPGAENTKPHLPSSIASTGSRKFFRRERKPQAAGNATNCLDCSYEQNCEYSAKKIYLERHLMPGNTGWPVKIVNPEIEDIYRTTGKEAAAKQLLKDLGEDYTSETPAGEVEARPWFGRCVWEADNDVCDDQYVTVDWEDEPIDNDSKGHPIVEGRAAKTAQFHMVAFTEKICERRGRIYGSKGEIEYDSKSIKVHSFATGQTVTHNPHIAGGGHGGGDEGLARQFLMAVNAVDSNAMSAADAQRKFLGCDLEEAFRSHAMVFAAEEARTRRQVIDLKKWWGDNVEVQVHHK
ncbi:streptomycin biosynthesis protein StrI [Plenodomus tracheiphilus IPT5]|uniref:Streptomycin biosynthesis protein StrI n=1 Tax=Plenodomus tracheiphilus IPT5 TaxID=1408161 RepID=A0A6A7BD98_9PLEO|nr:streptomycin biosynthesis protein StrI [Plenodomus tracheiphilus IPT5]